MKLAGKVVAVILTGIVIALEIMAWVLTNEEH